MSYVDAYFDRNNDVIKIVERNEEGQREFKDIPVKHTLYYKDPKGRYQSIYGDPLSKIVCKNTKEYRKELHIHSTSKTFEADINPIFATLSENYLNHDAPKLNVAFYDIEVDFDPERGYASPDDAFMPITSIAVHLQWLDTLICLAVPPKTLTMEEATEQVKEFPNTFLYKTEAELLDTFLTLIEDADIISGWNSEGFDIPYTVNRVTKVLSKDDTRRFCLFDQFPKRREYERYGKLAVTYDFVGRIHLDSLQLYQKYTYEERHSFRLDAIAEYELGDRKTQYEGTLDQLYNNDFKTFIEYNRQDTMLLDSLDKKLKFIDLANTIAHENTVLLQTTMGAVAVTEQAIINESHRRGFVVPNRRREDAVQAAGAYVAYPKEGIHDWIGSLDINSLYPSVIRALNMGPETIVGQLRPIMTDEYINVQMAKGKSFAAAWEGLFGTLEYTAVMNDEIGTDITVDWENGDTDVLSAAEVYRLVFESNQPWVISANGTIFSTETEGVIPGLLKRWYAERKDMQKKLKEAIAAGNKIQEEYWDKRQLVKKINLNSLYGAILNPGCRFFDKRIGQSTTLTGRQVAKHMAAKVNEIITGEYNHVGKSIIYGDSVTGDSMINIENREDMSIADLFESIPYKVIQDGGKEYATPTAGEFDLKVLGYNAYEDEAVFGSINYVMRHKTTKQLYKITTEYGNEITVTEDHSIIVDRDGFILDIKPMDLLDTDLLISLNKEEDNISSTQRQRIAKIEKLPTTEEYVYDISMQYQDPIFFANGIAVHNTDSVYFSAYKTLKDDIDAGSLPWTKETIVQLYDQIGEQVNGTFQQFMLDAFHCPKTRGEVIKAGREIVGSKSLFITKKRYAVLVYDKEGKRKDTHGQTGEIKAMGLDLKRSDTPEFIQDFLSKILTMVLNGETEQSVLNYISEFRSLFKARPGWEKGSPKRANSITSYAVKEDKAGKINMPGHVRASLNWNTLKQMYGDKYSMSITDGAKVIVCKLKPNPLGYVSVAYPVDELRLPQWFKDLPFDHNEMEQTIIDKKLDNLIGILNWKLIETSDKNTFNSLFDFD